MAGTDRPVLITDVGESPQAEYARRRRRYSAMMAGRIVCVIGAFVVGAVFHAIFVSLALIVGAAFLPWAAVLIANDRLPKAERARMHAAAADVGSAPRLTAGGGPTPDTPRDAGPPRAGTGPDRAGTGSDTADGRRVIDL